MLTHPSRLIASLLVAFAALGAPWACTAAAQPGLPGKGGGAADRPDGSKLATLTLLAERTAAPPGAEVTLALRFEITPDWHMYWSNPGDSGTPMLFEFDAPEHVELGDVRFPAPRRYEPAGGLTDFIYEDEAILLVPARISDDAPIGAALEIGVKAEWLICKDICIPGEGTSRATIRVASAESAPSDGSVFRRARGAMPRPESARVESAWRDGALRIRVPGATALEFFPALAPYPQMPSDIGEDGVAEGDTLVVRYRAGAASADAVAGVLSVRRAGRAEVEYYEFTASGPGVSP